jgi:hypothetical protein
VKKKKLVQKKLAHFEHSTDCCPYQKESVRSIIWYFPAVDQPSWDKLGGVRALGSSSVEKLLLDGGCGSPLRVLEHC